MKNLTVIIPAYNEERIYLEVISKALTLAKINYIIVDDGSDYPIELPNTLRRNKNKGYGSAIKYGIRHARSQYIAIIDADGQYDVLDLIDLWQSMDDEDMLIGKRINHDGGIKRSVCRFLMKTVVSLIIGRYIPDVNSGLRIFKKHIAKCYSSILCDEFSYTASITTAMVVDKYKVRWANIGFYPRQGSPSTVSMLRHGLITLYQIIHIVLGLRTRKIRKWLREK